MWYTYFGIQGQGHSVNPVCFLTSHLRCTFCDLLKVIFLIFSWPVFSFKVYFSSKLNVVDAAVVIITLVVTMIYTFSDMSGANLIPRWAILLKTPIILTCQSKNIPW